MRGSWEIERGKEGGRGEKRRERKNNIYKYVDEIYMIPLL